jgi:hypothetical protein
MRPGWRAVGPLGLGGLGMLLLETCGWRAPRGSQTYTGEHAENA